MAIRRRDVKVYSYFLYGIGRAIDRRCSKAELQLVSKGSGCATFDRKNNGQNTTYWLVIGGNVDITYF